MKKIFICMAAAALALMSCSDDFNDDAGGAIDFVVEAPTDKYYSSTGTITFQVTSSELVNWEIVECPEWSTPVSVTGVGVENISLNIDESRESLTRVGVLRVNAYYNGEIFKCVEFSIRQNGIGSFIAVDAKSGESQESPYEVGFSQEIVLSTDYVDLTSEIYTNIQWQAVIYEGWDDSDTTTPDWIDITYNNPDEFSGIGSTEIILSQLIPNEKYEERCARIVVTPLSEEATTNTTAVFYIVQGAYVAPKEIVIKSMVDYVAVDDETTLVLRKWDSVTEEGSNSEVSYDVAVSVNSDAGQGDIGTTIELLDGVSLDQGRYTMVKCGDASVTLGGYMDVDSAGGCTSERWDTTFVTFGGNVSNPIEITSNDDLTKLVTVVNGGDRLSGVYFAQTQNISLEDYDNWTPIGNSIDTPFAGVYDGGGYEISNLQINTESQNNGLFGYLQGDSTSKLCEVKNITLTVGTKGAIINSAGSGNTGTIAAIAMEDVLVEGCTNYLTVTAGWFSGGIVAVVGKGDNITPLVWLAAGSEQVNTTIRDCHNYGEMTLNTSSISRSDYSAGGGIVGLSMGTITECSNHANITSTIVTTLGGVVGVLMNTVTECYNVGTVDGTSSCGGIAGTMASGAQNLTRRVENCYNLGDIVLDAKSCGGIVGSVDVACITCNNVGYIKNCYNNVTSSTNNTFRGGAVGLWCNPVYVSGCFFLKKAGYTNYQAQTKATIPFLQFQEGLAATDTAISNPNDYVCKTGGFANEAIFTTSKMCSDVAFVATTPQLNESANWDFTDVWVMSDDGTRPILQWEKE
ncbi:MAG: hypothetical protein SNI46_04215 [Rikenellaceae bacterium]